MTQDETDRTHAIVHDTIELYEELVNMGHSPQFAVQIASSALTNYRLEIIALEIDKVREMLNMLMAVSAIEKIRAIKVEDHGDLSELFEMMRRAKGAPKQ